jgi:uncharacterized protein YbaP (TraB family)
MSLISRLARAASASLIAVSLLVTASCASTTASRPAAASVQEPAMWVVRDEDSTLYLFGTVHVMKPDAAWRTPRIAAALAASDELVLEIKEVDDPTAAMAGIQRHGLDLHNRLSSKLTADENARLAVAARAMGMDPAAFEPLRPWLVSLQLVVGALTRAGYAPEAGVDKLLKAEALRAGKRIAAFETIDQQLGFFGALPPEVELMLLRESLDDFDQSAAVFDPLAAGWLRGDLDALERYMVTDWKDQAPTLYRTLIVNRNIDWANQIETRLEGSGTSFIAVGAGHLVGPDSLQVQLRRKGIGSARY